MIKFFMVFLTAVVSLYAQQKPFIAEIESEIEQDTLLIVNYFLKADSSQTVSIEAAVKSSADSSFMIPVNTASGDIGGDIRTGKKTFTWNFKADAPELVKGEIGRMGIRTDLEYMIMTGQYYIDVTIGEDKGIPWYYYAAGGGAAVILGALFLSGGDDSETVAQDSNFPLPPGTR